MRLLPCLLAATLALLRCTTARADPDADDSWRPGLHASVSALGVSGFGPMTGRRLPNIAYGESSNSTTQVFFGAGLEAAAGVSLRPDFALAVDIAVLGGLTTELSYDTSPNLSATRLVGGRALVVADWRVRRHLELRAGAGFERMSFTAPIDDDELSFHCAGGCPPTDTRSPTVANGPALLLGAGVLLGKPGRVNVNLGVDLSAAYLVSDVETFVPLTASLRVGATAF